MIKKRGTHWALPPIGPPTHTPIHRANHWRLFHSLSHPPSRLFHPPATHLVDYCTLWAADSRSCLLHPVDHPPMRPPLHPTIEPPIGAYFAPLPTNPLGRPTSRLYHPLGRPPIGQPSSWAVSPFQPPPQLTKMIKK